MKLDVDVIESRLPVQQYHFRNPHSNRYRELQDQTRAGGLNQSQDTINALTADPGFLFLMPVRLVVDRFIECCVSYRFRRCVRARCAAEAFLCIA